MKTIISSMAAYRKPSSLGREMNEDDWQCHVDVAGPTREGFVRLCFSTGHDAGKRFSDFEIFLSEDDILGLLCRSRGHKLTLAKDRTYGVLNP
jgi:hypothetical protein